MISRVFKRVLNGNNKDKGNNTMSVKEIRSLLTPKGEYTKTELENYSELSAGKIKVAITQKKPVYTLPLFNLIEDKDTSVGSEVEKRIGSIENKFYTHKAGEGFDASVEEIIKAAVHAKLFGISVVELYLDESNNFAFEFIPREYYYLEEDVLYFKKGKTKFRPQEPKFYTITHKPVLLRVLWVVYAKHFVLSHYLKFAEFLGVPPLIGNAHSSDADVIDGMAQAVKNIKSASYAVLGPEDMLKVLEGKGSQADFLEFVRYVDTEIAKVINGASLGSNVAKSGSYAQSQSHEQNRDEIIKADVKFATRIANKLFAKIGKTLDLNIQIEKDVDLLQRAQTLQILKNIGFDMDVEVASKEFDLQLINGSGELNTMSMGLQRLLDMGLELSIEDLREMFKLKAPQNKQDTLVKQNEPAQEPNTRLSKNAKETLPIDAIDAHMESKSFNDSLRAQEQEILETIKNLAKECESYEEVYDKLQAHYATMEFKRLDEAMFKAIAGNLIVGAVDGE